MQTYSSGKIKNYEKTFFLVFSVMLALIWLAQIIVIFLIICYYFSNVLY